MSKELNEFFGMPVKSTLEAKLDGIPLYSSPELKKKYIEVISKQKSTTSITKDIIKLVEKRMITPVWLNKNILHLIGYKLFAPGGIKSIAGFFTPTLNRIFLLIDNNTNFGFTNDEQLALLTRHEAMHLFSNKKNKLFFKYFYSELHSYYKNYFSLLFDLKGNFDKEIDSIIKFIYKKFEENMINLDNPTKEILEYVTYLHALKKYSKLEKEIFDTTVKDFISCISLFLNDMNAFLNKMRRYSNILRPMYRAYRDSFGKVPTKTICIQELIYPSEVISILSELKSDSKINNVFKILTK